MDKEQALIDELVAIEAAIGIYQGRGHGDTEAAKLEARRRVEHLQLEWPGEPLGYVLHEALREARGDLDDEKKEAADGRKLDQLLADANPSRFLKPEIRRRELRQGHATLAQPGFSAGGDYLGGALEPDEDCDGRRLV